MGSFSWLRANVDTEKANIAEGDKFACLIPKEFGGGYHTQRIIHMKTVLIRALAIPNRDFIRIAGLSLLSIKQSLQAPHIFHRVMQI